MNDQQQQRRPPTARRSSRSNRKRYSNLGSSTMAVVEAASAQEESDRRKSFALDVEEIPSFRRLIADNLFDSDDEEQPQRRRESRRSSNCNPQTKLRKSKRTSKKDSRKEKRSSIHIQETKVVVQRVSPSDDALFKDESSKSLHTDTTASMSTHSSLDFSEDPFFTTNHSSLSALHFCNDDNNDDDFFRKYSSCDINFQPKASGTKGNPKYKNLGSRVKAATTEDVLFVPPCRTPADLMPMAVAARGVSPQLPPRYPQPQSSSHTRTRLSPRPRRRNSLSDMKKTADECLLPAKTEYTALLGSGSQHQWSLKNLVARGKQHRERQQEALCQHFFGEDVEK